MTYLTETTQERVSDWDLRNSQILFRARNKYPNRDLKHYNIDLCVVTNERIITYYWGWYKVEPENIPSIKNRYMVSGEDRHNHKL